MMRFAFYETVSGSSTQKYFPKKLMCMIFFRAMPCHYFSVPIFSVPCRAKIFRAKIFRAGPCHKSPGPPVRAVPELHLVAARVLATYFIPGRVGRGVRLGSENSSGGGGTGGSSVWESGILEISNANKSTT